MNPHFTFHHNDRPQMVACVKDYAQLTYCSADANKPARTPLVYEIRAYNTIETITSDKGVVIGSRPGHRWVIVGVVVIPVGSRTGSAYLHNWYIKPCDMLSVVCSQFDPDENEQPNVVIKVYDIGETGQLEP
jgi:hypothetical protein